MSDPTGRNVLSIEGLQSKPMIKAFIPSNLPLEERTVGQILTRQADRLADKNFIETTSGDCISYRDMHLRSNQFAQGTAAFGIGYQEPVLVMLPDTIDYVTVWCGLAKRGAIEVPINLAYRKSILKRLCNESTAKKINSSGSRVTPGCGMITTITSCSECSTQTGKTAHSRTSGC